MNTIFSDFSKDVDLSIFRESNKDPKTPLRRHYLSLVGLLEYVDILNGDLPGHALPKGMTVDDVKRMVSHAINDLDTKEAMSTDSSLPEHDYVDLGLPSGTLWATENIKDADGKDLYFAWGETRGYTKEQVKKYGWYGAYTYNMNKYNENDGLTVLELEDDAATVNWGEEWKIPTKEQFEELIANTTFVSPISSGKSKFTSTVDGYTDKFIVLPGASYVKSDGEIAPVPWMVRYWSASRSDSNHKLAYYLAADFGAPKIEEDLHTRVEGLTIYPVRTQGIDRTQGTQGTQGTQSTQGTQGTEGTQGTQGTQGTEGTQGTQGTQGTEGTQGTQGTEGTQGA